MMNETSHWYIDGLFGLWVYIFVIPELIGFRKKERNNAIL